MWQYSINFKQVSIISLKEFTLEMEKIKQIFVVMLLSSMKAGQSAQIILLRELINFQNVVTIGKRLISPLHESAVHHINIKNQKISYSVTGSHQWWWWLQLGGSRGCISLCFLLGSFLHTFSVHYHHIHIQHLHSLQ